MVIDATPAPAKLADLAYGAFAAGQHHRAADILQTYLRCPGIDRVWGLGLLEDVLRRLEVDASGDERARLAAERERIRTTMRTTRCVTWAHRWEQARQANHHAWSSLETGALAEGLEAAAQSLAFWPYFLPHVDTRVRLLLAAGRQEEAWEEVRWAWALQPDWGDFTDIATDPAWQAWCAARSTPPAVPPGLATLGEYVPCDLPPEEGVHRVRLGRDEWHRARNAAVVAMLSTEGVSCDDLAVLRPHALDLSRGAWVEDGRRVVPGTLEVVRHWLLYGYTNHPGHQAETRPGMRERLFVDAALEPLSPAALEAIWIDAWSAAEAARTIWCGALWRGGRTDGRGSRVE